MADEVDPEALADELAAFDVDQFLVAAASTLASLAFAKLEGGDLGQARKAIDTLAALLPHVESGLQRRPGAGADEPPGGLRKRRFRLAPAGHCDT